MYYLHYILTFLGTLLLPSKFHVGTPVYRCEIFFYIVVGIIAQKLLDFFKKTD